MAAIKSFRDRKTFIRFPPIRSQPLPLCTIPLSPIPVSLCSFLSLLFTFDGGRWLPHRRGISLFCGGSLWSQLSFTRISHLPLEIENRSLLLTPNDFHLATVPQISIFTEMKIGRHASKIAFFPLARGVLCVQLISSSLFQFIPSPPRRAYTITVSRVINHETWIITRREESSSQRESREWRGRQMAVV